ncbi:enoyl-CoA hydratase/isomerase family protein [Sneathiella aquimaris]|uniref:enoyl-CoA hydratase/isomerase family protein n=1 Tax=Sneathiella aquimaris TaxID=2599305 RepID=UPI00146E9F09|nr:enoyl-CoA hydratase-related protein [Sneathiella aquimaris]
MTDHLLLTKHEGVAELVMNRPKVRNAMSLDMRQAMFDAIGDVEQDPQIRCVVLKGAGGHFMAGGDVKGFADFKEMTAKERAIYFEHRVAALQPMLLALQRMPKPVIASVEGGAVGAGMSFMMACDLAIAADNAFFKFSYAAIGASPDGSGSYYLPRLVGLRKAMEISLMPEIIKAEAAKDLGLVNWVVPTEDLQKRTETLAQTLANGPTTGYGCIKELMYASHANSLPMQLSLEAKNWGRCAATQDWLEGITSFTEKRQPQYKGY